MNKNKPIPKAQVRKTPHGWQVYAAGPKGYIAQGQPHRDLGAAKRDAQKFSEETEIDEKTAGWKKDEREISRGDSGVARKHGGVSARDDIDDEGPKRGDTAAHRGARGVKKVKGALIKSKPLYKRTERPGLGAAMAVSPGKGYSARTDYNKPMTGRRRLSVKATPKVSLPGEYVPQGTEFLEADVKKTKKKELFKSRKYRFTTPGQDRDFETLDANRMFKSYEEIENEDAPTTSTAGVANWDPLLGGRKREVDVYFKRRKKIGEDGRIDGRTRSYRETVQRVQARRDATAARDLEQKLNMFGVQSNPFKEDTQMENNKKYLKTKEGSIEDAVLHSMRTEAPFNPNDVRPTLHLPEKKYLDTKVGSLEKAVIDAMVSETISGNMLRDLRTLPGKIFRQKYRMSKADAQRAGAGITQGKSVADVKAYEEHTPEEDAYDYKAKKGAIAAPGSGSIAKAKKAKSSDVNKSIEQQMADARKEEVELDEFGLATLPKSARGRQHPQNPNRDPGAKSPEEAPIGTHTGRFLGQRDRPKKKVDPRHPQGAVTSLPKVVPRSRYYTPKEESVEIDEFGPGGPGGVAKAAADARKKAKEAQQKRFARSSMQWGGERSMDAGPGGTRPHLRNEYEPQGTEIDESWKKVKPTDRVQRLDQLSISGWLSKQMGRKGDPHRFNARVPSIYFDDVDLVIDSDTVVPKALSGNATMADLLKKVQAHAKKKRLRFEEVEMTEGSKEIKTAIRMARRGGGAMTPTTKEIEKKYPGMTKQKHVKAALQKYNEEDGYDEQSAAGRGERGVGSQAYTDYIRNLTPGETAVKDKESKESSSASKQASAEKKRQVTKIDDAVDPAVKMTTDKYKQEKTKMKQDHILDVAKIKASKVGEEVIVGLLDMGIIQIDENKETGFTVINAPLANRENLLRMAFNIGSQILNEYVPQGTEIDEGSIKSGGDYDKKGSREYATSSGGARERKHGGVVGDTDVTGKAAAGQSVDAFPGSARGFKKVTRKQVRNPDARHATFTQRRPHELSRGVKKVPGAKEESVEIDEKKVSSDAYDHATALYKDQWKDRKIADYDKEHDRDSRAKEMRADAGEDRKRMYGLTQDKWKHAKYATGEEEGKKSVKGNTPDPKDAYKKEELSPLISASVRAIGKIVEKDLSYKERQGMSKGEFALPGQGSGPEGKQGGSYPIPDESHARNALARVSQHGSEAEKKKVRAAVAKKFPGIKIG